MISTITETAVAMGAWVELSILSKATVMLLLGLVAARLAGRARASVRHLILATTFATMLALPLIAALAPGLTIDVPVSPASQSIAAPGAVPQPEAPVTSIPDIPVRRISEGDGSSAMSLPAVVRLLWIAGALLMLVSPAVGLWRLRRIRRESLPWPEMGSLVQSLANRGGIRRAVDILIHEEIAAPLTLGVWRPAIVLPCDATEWSEADLRRALVHELEHVRRGDWMIQLAIRATCAFYWFHPLVWVAWRRLRLEAERAADDAVVESTERTEYAEQLVMLARRMSRSHGQAMLGMANRSDLSARVSTLLDGTQRRGRAGLLAAASALCVASLLLLVIAPVRAIALSAKPSAVRTDESGLLVDVPAFVERTVLTQPLQETKKRRSASLDQELFEAAESGDMSAIGELINAGANVNSALDGDGSPLIAAARSGHVAAVRLLLDRGADPNTAVSGDGNPLIMAAHNGHLAVVRLLLDRGANPNMPVPGDGNPLIMAAREGHVEIVALLLDRGASIDEMVPDDENALIQASGEGHFDVVKLLVARRADVNARAWVEPASKRPNGEWRTPLSMARKGGHAAIVALLLEAGARD